jgi:hypothetical protein
MCRSRGMVPPPGAPHMAACTATRLWTGEASLLSRPLSQMCALSRHMPRRSTAEQTRKPDIHPCSPHSKKGSFDLRKAPPRLQCRERSGFLLAAHWSCHQPWVTAKGALPSHPWRKRLRQKLRAQLRQAWKLHLQTQPRPRMLRSLCGLCRAAQQILRHSKAKGMLRVPPHSWNSRSTAGASVMLRS